MTYYGNRISPNMVKTDEGFLICLNVPIARTGQQEYTNRDLWNDSADPDGRVMVNRVENEVFAPAAIASFEGKPVTDGHPRLLT